MVLGIPLFVFAAGLVPCTACTLCDLYLLAQNIIDFLMWQATPIIAIFAFSWAGFKILISGPNPGLRSEGFGIMRKTLIGILIVFSSWIIINEVILFFSGTSKNAGIGGTVLANPWNKVDCALPATPPVTEGPAYDGPDAPAIQAQPRQTLAMAGINAKDNYCGYFDYRQTTSCTTLVQLPNNAIQGLINLREGCACTIFITGGTEKFGHDTHGPGIAVVDVQKNSVLDSYITQSFGPGTQVFNANQVFLGTLYSGGGITYLDEVVVNGQPAHWHISW